MITTTDTPARNLRVSRCSAGHGYFAYPSGYEIGCLVCGRTLATTTRQQRQQPWQILDKDEAAQASRLEGGLPSLIAWTRKRADGYFERAVEALLDPEAEIEIVTEPRWKGDLVGDRMARKGHSGWGIDRALREGTRLLDKVARLERKLAKLGGPTPVYVATREEAVEAYRRDGADSNVVWKP